MHILHIPSEILTEVFSYLDERSRVSAALVCKLWKEIAYTKKLWKKTVAKVKLDSFSTYIKHTNINGFTATSKKSKKRKVTYTSEEFVWPESFFALLNERGISKVVLSSARNLFLEQDLKNLNSNIPDLKYLKLAFESHKITSRTVSHCFENIQFLQLKSLDLSFNKFINQRVIRAIAVSMPNLESLNLQSCLSVTDDCLEQMTIMASLKHLNISNTEITDFGLAILSGMKMVNTGDIVKRIKCILLTNLRTLNIENCQDLTWVGLRYIGEGTLVSLETLVISQILGCEGFGIECLSSLNSLKCLSAVAAGLPDNVFEILADSGSNLENLSLSFHSSINDRSLEFLSRGFQNLILMRLRSTSITDIGVDLICANLPQLLFLDISYNCYITDRALRVIGEKLSRLLVLNIEYCERVTSKGVSHFISTSSCVLIPSQASNILNMQFYQSDILRNGAIKKWMTARKLRSLCC
ncbi:F-box/LRR-repeat protein 14-like [Physella acuta]|uniref:F-box/LRR-repeat protein 14-like n=1 Tax=Physella acuta TaxID=109671 RepID=UPI0027DE0C23|nr:F-box/LRR-repeat protein 14-like [Physella acuta]